MKIKIGDVVIYTDNIPVLASRGNINSYGWELKLLHDFEMFVVTKKSVVDSKIIKLLFAK